MRVVGVEQDQREFADFYAAAWDDCLRIVMVGVGDRALAEDLVAAWDVVHAAFAEHDAPSTLLGVTTLGYRDQLVEVEAVALLTAPATAR